MRRGVWPGHEGRGTQGTRLELEDGWIDQVFHSCPVYAGPSASAFKGQTSFWGYIQRDYDICVQSLKSTIYFFICKPSLMRETSMHVSLQSVLMHSRTLLTLKLTQY